MYAKVIPFPTAPVTVKAENPVIYREKLLKFLETLNGKIVTVDFWTKTGRVRTLNGRLGVRKYVKGVRGWDMASRPDLTYIIMYEMPKPNTNVKGGYRNVDLTSVMAIRTKGVEYDIV